MTDFSSGLDLAAAIRRRELTAVEALDASLEAIDRLNPTLNAVIWRDDEGARAEAARADEALASGDADALPPFHGVPLPIKDLTPVAGWPVTYGSHGAPEGPSEESELVVDAFRRAGFVLCGRTNTPEFGPITVTENLRYGPTCNPWDPSRSPGGSSGGAAAATAAGMFPLAHANDGGGSIRIPAACCGLVGLKPSRGRVPRLTQSWEGAAVEGVVTHTVSDSAAVLDAIAGVDRLGWWSAPQPSRPYADEVGAEQAPLRVGLATGAPLGLPLDDSCADAARHCAELLEGLGHSVEPVQFDTLPGDLVEPFLAFVRAGFADFPGVDWSKTEPHNRAGYEDAQHLTALQYAEASRYLQLRSRELVAPFGRDFDVLVTPTLSIEQPQVGSVLEAAHATPGEPVVPVIQMIAFTMFGNLTGLPAISLPLHWTESGLPAGAQIMGGAWDEATLIRLASALEEAAPWADRRPDTAALEANVPQPAP
ncbi:MAG TPA: amidase [Thermoleophilaceae bacterium]|nr:amidase [Thermoleophilaceae bacterium]